MTTAAPGSAPAPTAAAGAASGPAVSRPQRLPVVRLEGVRYPVNIRTGSGMTLTGTANSATGTTLTGVQVAILDAADQTVQSAAAQANAAARSPQ